MTARSRLLAGWLPPIWAASLAVLLLGPALGPGYVLSYDMVWVPDLALRPDFLGVGSALPRAVPSDAVVAVLDEVVPGMLLQKLVLLGALVGGGVGAARLGPSGLRPGVLAGRLLAVSVYVWSPFVAERLVLGHWPVLLCYAVLPWAVLAGQRSRRTGRVPPVLLLVLVVGSLSANAGLMTGVVLLAFAVDRTRPRLSFLIAGLVAAANAPWVVAGLLHAPDAVTSGAAAPLFALSDVGTLPAPLAALGLGGVWNAEAVLASRAGLSAWLALGFLIIVVGAGLRPLKRAWPRRDVLALAGCWALGWVVAVGTWALPDLVGWLAGHVPGAGLLRDGSRFLALCAPALAATAGHGAAAVVARAPGTVSRTALAVGLVLAPVAVMPDAASGASGRLRPVHFPREYAEARAEIREHWRQGGTGDVVLLPFTSYRAPAWNGGRKVLDPLGRYLPVDYVANDELVVDGTTVPGEDPRARKVARALDLAPSQRSEALAALGVGLVVEAEPDGDVTVTALEEVSERQPPSGWWAAMGLAWSCYALVPLLLLVRLGGWLRRRSQLIGKPFATRR